RALPDLEARVARAKVELLLVAGAIWDVALAIDAGDLAVRSDHGERIVMMRSVELEVAGRDPDLQLFGELLHRQHRRVFGGPPGGCEQALVLDPAELGTFEQLRRQDHLGTLA